jgi:RNA polymerase sigma-70 factor (ECF subfamily)
VSLFDEPADPDVAAAEDGAEVTLRRAALREAMNRLDPRERELVALRFFAGLGHGEIAEVLGISASNAGTRLHRAVDKLRRLCDESA